MHDCSSIPDCMIPYDDFDRVDRGVELSCPDVVRLRAIFKRDNARAQAVFKFKGKFIRVRDYKLWHACLRAGLSPPRAGPLLGGRHSWIEQPCVSYASPDRPLRGAVAGRAQVSYQPKKKAKGIGKGMG